MFHNVYILFNIASELQLYSQNRQKKVATIYVNIGDVKPGICKTCCAERMQPECSPMAEERETGRLGGEDESITESLGGEWICKGASKTKKLMKLNNSFTIVKCPKDYGTILIVDCTLSG